MNIIIGLGGLFATLYAARGHLASAGDGYFHPAAFILLLGAPPAILLVGNNLHAIWDALKVLAEALRHDPRRVHARLLGDLYRFGRELKQARSIEAGKVLAEAGDPLLRDAGGLLLQPGGATEVRDTIATLGYARLARIRAAEDLFRTLFRVTPAVGLMGTIIGLVNMLRNLRNFEQIGPAMAVAQLATFYGLILAYGLWAPLSKRIENYGRDVAVNARLLERGLASIAEGRSLYDLRMLSGTGAAADDGGAAEKAA